MSASERARRNRNLYRRGRAHEHKVRHTLEAQGYYVMRSAGSKGVWDLIAFQPGKATRLVQAKSRTLPSPEERRAMATCPVPAGWERELWMFLSHKPPRIIVVDTDAWYDLGRREAVAVTAAEQGAGGGT